MNLTISGHHLEVTPALRGYVTSKLERILRHFDQVVDVKVLLTVEKQKEKDRRQRAECSLHVKGNDLFVESMHADLYAAMGVAAANPEKGRLRKYRSAPFLMVPARQHFVIYDLVPQGIAVLTVQHQVRDIESLIADLTPAFHAEVERLERKA